MATLASTGINGISVARVTDQATCPNHKGAFPIVDGGVPILIVTVRPNASAQARSSRSSRSYFSPPSGMASCRSLHDSDSGDAVVVELRISILFLLAIAAGCANYSIEAAPMDQIQSLAEATLILDGKPVSVTPADLEQIKGALLQKLGEDPEREDLNSLHEATSSEPCFITEDGVGHIGAWTLREQAGRVVLIRTVQRSKSMLVPIATLSFEEGRWQVLQVDATMVRGR